MTIFAMTATNAKVMAKDTLYIKDIAITNIFGCKDVFWQLFDDVNILGGINGETGSCEVTLNNANITDMAATNRGFVGSAVMLNYKLQGEMPQRTVQPAELQTESFAPYSSNQWWTPPDDDPAWYLSTDSDPHIYWQGQGYIETVWGIGFKLADEPSA